jgi:hypothetical protein
MTVEKICKFLHQDTHIILTRQSVSKDEIVKIFNDSIQYLSRDCKNREICEHGITTDNSGRLIIRTQRPSQPNKTSKKQR